MSEPLAVALVCYPSLGGSGVVGAELALGLAQRGHRVHLVASAPPGRAGAACAGLRFHRVELLGYPLFDHPPYTVAVASALIDLARAQRVDVVHVHYAVPHAASAQLARAALGDRAPRVVTTLHGTDVTNVGSAPAYRSATAFAVAASDAVTVPSESLRREAFAALGLPPGTPVAVVPNFVDTDHFAPPPARDRGVLARLFDDAATTRGDGGGGDGPVLFHVSNFRPVKRVGDLLDVLRDVRRHVPARLVLVGDGPERAAVEERARALGVAAAVRFLGRRTDFADLLRHADAFVLASERESFGVAALEALACGVPVAAYRVGGLPELVTGDVGTLVAPLDAAALADAVLALVTDAGHRETFGRAARARALAHFRREPALERFEACYRGVLGGARPTSPQEAPRP